MKNWFKKEDLVYQKDCPGPSDEWAAVEDFEQIALDEAWERIKTGVPIYAPLTLELMERIRVMIQVRT